MDASNLFARNYLDVRYEDLSKEVVDITKSEILDTLGVTAAGFGQAAAKQVLELARDWGGTPQSSIIGTRLKVPAPNAAQVNASMAHARDYDDVHEAAVMHPGVIAIPVALAIGELVGGMTGKEFITAVALGADMICRLGLASRPGVSPIHTGWHYTTLYGYPTAALTAGKILGLDEEQMIAAFGIAYHQCSGNSQCVTDGTLTKRLGPGFAVRGGVTAALLAQRGVTGARNSLEGKNGLFNQYHFGEYDRNILIQDLGRHFEGINVSLKPYPCCRGVHVSIDAALALSAKYNIDAAGIKEISIITGAANHQLLCTPFEAKIKPRNPVDAQFSIPWGVATALLRRRVGMEDYSAAAVADPELLRLAAKITATVDPALSSPMGIEPALLTVVMDNGESFHQRVDLPKGTPGQPISLADSVGKFADCVSFIGMGGDKVRQSIDMVDRLENLEDVRKLIQLFTC